MLGAQKETLIISNCNLNVFCVTEKYQALLNVKDNTGKSHSLLLNPSTAQVAVGGNKVYAILWCHTIGLSTTWENNLFRRQIEYGK